MDNEAFPTVQASDMRHYFQGIP